MGIQEFRTFGKLNLARIILTVAAIYALFCVALFFFQDSVIYQPRQTIHVDPSLGGMDFEEIRFRASDGVVLHGWYVSARQPSGRALLFFHGNAGNISHRIESLRIFHELGHILLNENAISDLSLNPQWEVEKWCNSFAAEVLVPSEELLRMVIVRYYQQQGQKEWLLKDLVELGKHFHVGPLAILRSLLENGLTTKAFYTEKHEKWNKPQFGRAKNPEGRNLAKEAVQEKGKTYIGLAFKAFDQNPINIKDLSDSLGVKLSYIPKTRQFLNA